MIRQLQNRFFSNRDSSVTKIECSLHGYAAEYCLVAQSPQFLLSAIEPAAFFGAACQAVYGNDSQASTDAYQHQHQQQLDQRKTCCLLHPIKE